jgi:2-keto-4-pentenoate hydratase/2-oxohepta-3-ene-1,7-dioic acid hydratase in catechol pathway
MRLKFTYHPARCGISPPASKKDLMMRLVSFLYDDGPAVGFVTGGNEAIIPVAINSMLELIESGPQRVSELRERGGAPGGTPIPLLREQLLAPIPQPRRNVFCLGLNYVEHAKESFGARGREVKLPTSPVFFTKATNAVNGPYANIPFDAAVSSEIDWEVELGVVIGRRGKNIPAAEAMDYVFGYTIINDISARDLQTGHGGQFFKGKSLDGSCPMGPWIVTADDIPDPHALTLRCRVNGETKQEATTADMLFKIPAIIEILSRGLTLEPGDVIATGTPSGVGFARTPPEFLKPGDLVECEVEGIGTISNTVG